MRNNPGFRSTPMQYIRTRRMHAGWELTLMGFPGFSGTSYLSPLCMRNQKTQPHHRPSSIGSEPCRISGTSGGMNKMLCILNVFRLCLPACQISYNDSPGNSRRTYSRGSALFGKRRLEGQCQDWPGGIIFFLQEFISTIRPDQRHGKVPKRKKRGQKTERSYSIFEKRPDLREI